VQAVEDLVELEALVGLDHFLVFPENRVQGEPVQGKHVPRGHGVGRAKPAQVAQDEPARIADSAVGLDKAVYDLVGDADVVAVVHGRGPDAQDFRAVFVDDLLGRDHVAHGLGHLAALAAHHVAVGQHGLVGRHAARADGDQKRAVEPAAVLVRALQVHVRREAAFGALLDHGGEARAGVEPHVQDVVLLLPVRAAAVGAGPARGHALQGGLEPVVAAARMGGESVGDVLIQAGSL
jgi:hypothetical protein